jgi:hypothetical protein
VGNLFRHDGEHAFIQTTTPKNTFIQLYAQCIEKLKQTVCAQSILIKDALLFEKNYFQQQMYNSFNNDISMVLQIEPQWQTLKDYEKALKHKYAQRMRKIQRAFADISIQPLSLQDVDTYKHQMHALYLQVANKQSITLGTLNAQYFYEFKKALQENLKVFGMFYNNKLIAFSTAIVHHQKYDMNYIGFDYAYNADKFIYFNLLFHCIEQAIVNQCHKLILGRTALEAKAILGCKPEQLYNVFKINNVFLNWLAQKFTRASIQEQGDMWMQRHPFK